MGTVGINFGAASSGQGFDVASTVTAILASDQAIETPWQTQLTALQAQDTVFTTLGTDLSTLTTAMQSLTDFSGVMAEKQGSSSDTNVLALTAASTAAVAGSHTVLVSQLAQTSSDYSDAVANAADTLSGSLTIQVGSGTSQTITVDSNSNTLASLASAINSANIGVNASVISDVSGSRLSLVSGTSGTAGQLTISGALSDATTSTAIGFATGQSGQNASLTVDGLAINSGSNTVTTAIPGVTFQLLSVSASPIQVQITNDTSDVATAVSSVVSAYNAVIKDINGQEGNDSSGNAEPLFGSPTLALLQSQLSSALVGGKASGSISSITQIGIGFNQDGTLTLDGDTLNNVLNSDFSDVTGFLQNSGSFGQSFVTTLNNLGTQAPNGAIYLAQQQNSAQEAAFNLSISNEEATLATEKTNLTTELNTANQVLQSIPSQLSEMNELYSAVTGYNTGNGG
ncbi:MULTISPECIES: flagellar filament capping protein FliD [Acidobacteriaceae]|uniref:flagellar filament capping protein FliD n=1 Tax=Acidobacteriaceae TaxID=204434 RepID=UPI00131D1FAC|nr:MULTISPECIES: flagellar filament capping protein FliD [Acidobacteriaceae]MDW5264291.1 flagellar filament capping protein FliD [Edaphobacter sp.]